MAAYAKLPIDKLIADTVTYTHEGEAASHWAAAAVLGYSRGGLYLDTARSLIEQILADASEISWRMGAYDVVKPTIGGVLMNPFAVQLSSELVVEAVTHQQGALHLRRMAEVLWHFYASSLKHAWYFLKNSAQIVDPSFTPTRDEAEWIAIVMTFRNHMEHRDKAVSNLSSRDWQSMSREDQDVFELGYRLDTDGNVLYVPVEGKWKGQVQRMPINQTGFDHAESICQGIWRRIQPKCLQRLDQYFTAHPGEIPALDQVGMTMSDVIEPARGAHARG